MAVAKLSLQTFLFQIARYFAAFLGGMMSARILGPSGKGLLAFALIYPSLYFMLGHFSLGNPIIHHLGEKKYKKEEFVGNLLFFFLIITLFLFLIFGISYFFWKDILYQNIPSYLLGLAMLLLPLYLFIYYFSSFLQALRKIFYYNLLQNLPYFLIPFLILGFWIFWQYTPREGIFINLIIYGLTTILAFWLVFKIAPFPWKINKELFKRLFIDGGKLHLGAISIFLISRIDQVMIGNMLENKALGYYSVAVVIAELIWLISFSVQTVIYPEVASRDPKEAQELTYIATRLVLWFALGAGLFLALISKFIILLYGGKAFLPAILPLIILIPGMIFSAPTQIMSAWTLKQKWFLRSTLIATFFAILNIFLNFLFIPLWGINGAALATTITYGVALIITLFIFSYFFHFNIFSLLIIRKSDFQFLKQILIKRKIQ
jgi:O-antigen/teichoic acid export membrane protein